MPPVLSRHGPPPRLGSEATENTRTSSQTVKGCAPVSRSGHSGGLPGGQKGATGHKEGRGWGSDEGRGDRKVCDDAKMSCLDTKGTMTS